MMCELGFLKNENQSLNLTTKFENEPHLLEIPHNKLEFSTLTLFLFFFLMVSSLIEELGTSKLFFFLH